MQERNLCAQDIGAYLFLARADRENSFILKLSKNICVRGYNQGHSTWVTLLWYLSFSLPMLFYNGFSVELSQVWGQHWKGHGKGGWGPHVNVIRSIDPSSNVTDCSLNVVIKLKLFIFIFHHVLKWCHFCLLCQNKTKLAPLDWILVFLKHWEALVSRCLWYCLSVLS